MYKDVWDFTGPAAAGFYGLLHFLFGKSIVAYRAIAIVLVVIQAAIFNDLLLKNKAYNQNTYVPALLYAVFMHMSFDFFTLSPVLIGMTFVLLGIHNLFRRMDNTTRDDLFVKMGLNMAVATLFYLPFVLYFLVVVISLLVYTGSIVRRMFLMVYGFMLLMTVAGLYYFWYDALAVSWVEYLRSLVTIEPFRYFSWQQFALLTFVPIVIFIVSLVKTKTLGRYINFQIKIQSVMLMFTFAGIISIFMTKEVAVFQLIFIVPGIAFFASHYLLTLRSWIASEITFLVIAVCLVLNMLFPLKGWLFVDQFVTLDKLVVKETEYDELTRDKSLLVVGDHVELYKNSSLATPYLNYQFSKAHLDNLDYYDNLTAIFLNFQRDMPEVIIDEKGLIPSLFDKLPTLAAQYRAHRQWEHVYVLNQ